MVIRLSKGYTTGELYKGDTLGLNRVGGYYCFNIMERDDLNVSTRDLTNIHDILFVVQGEQKTIEIPEMLHRDIDRSIGQILFKFTKDDADQIFNSGSSTYYICSKVDDIYSVIYTGEFVEGDSATSLSDTITALNERLSALENEKDAMMMDYEAQLSKLREQLEAERLRAENFQSMYNQVKDELEAANSSLIQANIVNEYTIPQ